MSAIGPFTAEPGRGELEQQLCDVHSALTLIIAAAHMSANRDDLVDVGATANAIEQRARETAARVWELQKNLPPELANWEPSDEKVPHEDNDGESAP
jgi:hypothetical protein